MVAKRYGTSRPVISARTVKYYTFLLSATPPPPPQQVGDYVKSMVFGGLDGIMTTFAIVTAAHGGNMAKEVCLPSSPPPPKPNPCCVLPPEPFSL